MTVDVRATGLPITVKGIRQKTFEVI